MTHGDTTASKVRLWFVCVFACLFSCVGEVAKAEVFRDRETSGIRVHGVKFIKY